MERLPPEIRKDITKTYRQHLETGRRERILKTIEKIPEDKWNSTLSWMLENDLSHASEIAVSMRKNISQNILIDACNFNSFKIAELLLKRLKNIDKSVFMVAIAGALMNKNLEMLKLLLNNEHCKIHLGMLYRKVIGTFIEVCPSAKDDSDLQFLANN